MKLCIYLTSVKTKITIYCVIKMIYMSIRLFQIICVVKFNIPCSYISNSKHKYDIPRMCLIFRYFKGFGIKLQFTDKITNSYSTQRHSVTFVNNKAIILRHQFLLCL